MYERLSGLLSDKKGDIVFSCFGIWHLLYLAVIFGSIILGITCLRKKDEYAKKRAVNASIAGAFGLYMADFFLMPFAYGEIDLEKLPFHICTAMCVMCFLSRRNGFLGKFKRQFALLGLISNLIYVIYPAGVGWYQIHPLSYRVIQTLLFHGVMTAHGMFVLAFDDVCLEWKNLVKDIPVMILMILWALLGNTLYNGTYGGVTHFFNWCFVVRDPFYLLPEIIAPYLMPFVILLVMIVADVLVYMVYILIKSCHTNSCNTIFKSGGPNHGKQLQRLRKQESE
ncbi:MAG: YwaF family protein [Lachnospiraceae bacterium]|nr:YwaF family protein [Lachnospiraceae bacterium]